MPYQKHFTLSKQVALITSKGLSTVWWKSLVCPCRNRVDGSTNPVCVLCGGDGFYYYDPQTIKVAYTNLAFDRSLLMTGLLDEVTINATILGTNWISDGDRFIPATEEVVEQETLVRGATKPGGGTKERLMYRYPIELQKVVALNNNVSTEYIVGTDIELIADSAGYIRNIHWITAGPATGIQYSVRYRTTAEFIVFLSQPRVRIEGEVKQATFCRLKRITSMRGE